MLNIVKRKCGHVEQIRTPHRITYLEREGYRREECASCRLIRIRAWEQQRGLKELGDKVAEEKRMEVIQKAEEIIYKAKKSKRTTYEELSILGEVLYILMYDADGEWYQERLFDTSERIIHQLIKEQVEDDKIIYRQY